MTSISHLTSGLFSDQAFYRIRRVTVSLEWRMTDAQALLGNGIEDDGIRMKRTKSGQKGSSEGIQSDKIASSVKVWQSSPPPIVYSLAVGLSAALREEGKSETKDESVLLKCTILQGE
uniref:Uncharacterized protein n=1 Tax=Steinernema glaseri TaxID=37863 RepID=A0A1I7ZZB1_9BILA